MISDEQIAHDLTMVYLANRYGADVTGRFEVSTYGDDHQVTGEGGVETTRLPDPNTTRTVRVGTGERRFFNLLEKKVDVDTGEYEVDPVFRSMIAEYRAAYQRFLALLTTA